MREFIVTLRCGIRYTVKADRVQHENGYVSLVVARVPTVGDPHPESEVIALFERSQVAVVVARENLVSEEKTEPMKLPYFVAADRDSDVPF